MKSYGRDVNMILVSLLCLTVIISLLFTPGTVKADSDSGWGVATIIEIENEGSVGEPQVVVDNSGNAIAVWYQHDGSNWNIMANRYTVGYGWSTATLIEFDNSGDASSPEVDMDGSGNAIVVWHQHDGLVENIWANRYLVGIGWGTPTIVENDDTGDAFGPQIAVDATGNATAVWYQNDGALDHAWGNRYVVGVGWGTPALIETENLGNVKETQVANDGNGNAMAVWTQNDGIRDNIWANRYIVGFGWGTASLIETDNLAGAGDPQVGMDAAGNALAIWQQDTGAIWNVWSNRFDIGSGWGTPELIENDNSGDALRPQIAGEESGDALATWQQDDGSDTNIWASRYDVGSGWGTPVLLENENTGNAIDPKPALDGKGNAVVVFGIWSGSEWNIWSNQFNSMTGWGTATIIETENAGNAFRPEVSMDASGNAISVWYQDDGLRFNIWANRYIMPDDVAPTIDLTSPSNGLTTDVPTATVSGTTEPGVHLTVNGVVANVESDGTFEFQLALMEGENVITATATDSSGNSDSDSVTVTYTIPSSNHEQELMDTKEMLNQTLDELADMLETLNQTIMDLADTENELNITQEELAAIEADLAEAQSKLNDSLAEIVELDDDINDVEDELLTLQNDLLAFQTELDNIKKESGDGEEDKDSQDVMSLLLPLIMFVILLIIVLIIYMNLSKKISNMSGQSPKIKEEPLETEPSHVENEDQIDE
jgi:hypothetical protein